jgi:hypothetical protein
MSAGVTVSSTSSADSVEPIVVERDTLRRMSAERAPYVFESTLRLLPGADPAAVGAAVTIELCGHWEHEGECRWPHNNELRQEGETAAFRTLCIAPGSEADEVRQRIAKALATNGAWKLQSQRSRPLRADEEALAARLACTPLPTEP